MHGNLGRYAILLVWSGFLFGYGLSGPLYRTESLRAIIGQSALNGHWLTPTLYGEPFLTKPPGAYAAIGLASLPFGQVTEASARLPSAIAGTVVLCFLFSTLKRFLRPAQALAATLLLPVSMLWMDKVPSAEIDILQLAWVTLAILFLNRAVEAREVGSATWQWWLLAMTCVAGGFLTKWTAPAFFYLAAIPFLWVRGHFRWLFCRQHLLALLITGLCCGCWAYLAAREAGWALLKETVLREAAQRFAPKSVGKPYPWLESLTFPFVVLAANLPWSLPAIFACRPAFVRSLPEPEHRFVQLLHCWCWPNLLFWSLPAQHNVRYVLPLAPALALLGIFQLRQWCLDRSSRPFHSLRQVRIGLAGVLLAWCATKVVFVELVVPSRTAGRHARETGQLLANLVPEGEILYLCKLKDEGVLFYYSRPARRFDLASPQVGHAVLLDREWLELDRTAWEHVATLRDQQGDPIHLAKFQGKCKEPAGWLTRRRSNPSASPH